MKNKFITTVVATALALTMTFSLANGMDVKAAEITEDSLVAAEDTNVGNESVDIQQQEPVEISELETTENNDLSKSSESITVDESIAEDILATQADTAVVVGTVSDYLTAKGDAKLYNINLPAGVYLQAQLTTPANADLDYDLYLLDAEGNILTGSDYYTYINGTAGTLPEALGYITSGDTATYYLYVLASEGGSVSESFTLDYSVSTACDSYEIDESVRQALAFTYGAGGAYIESRNLSSPIDNDWYVITVPSSRIYDKLKISATTASTNTCSVEVYQNVASEGYQMKRVGSGNTISVSSGKYYIRVSNAKTMENFDDLDIQNYKLSITPILKATGIVITDLKGSEGLNKVVNYPGYGAHFRTQGSGTLTVYGVLTATDSSTGVTYAVGGEQINGLSNKICSAKHTRILNGENISGQLRYGYVKDPNDKHKIIVDPEAAEVVKLIFELTAQGKRKTEVANYLNAHGIDTPSAYKKRKGSKNFFHAVEVKSLWSTSSIHDILNDEVYLGKLIWNKTKKRVGSNNTSTYVPKDEWIVIENCHEPIITQKLFDTAHANSKKYIRPKRGKRNYNPFYYCGVCGRALVPSKRVKGDILLCSSSRIEENSPCKSNRVEIAKVENTIMKIVNMYATAYLDEKGIKKAGKSKEVSPEEKIATLEKKVKSLSSKKMMLYSDYKDDKLTREEYVKRSKAMVEQIDELHQEIEQLKTEIPPEDNSSSKFETQLESIINMESFDREKIQKVIKKVIINGEDNIEIIWNTDDPFFK